MESGLRRVDLTRSAGNIISRRSLRKTHRAPSHTHTHTSRASSAPQFTYFSRRKKTNRRFSTDLPHNYRRNLFLYLLSLEPSRYVIFAKTRPAMKSDALDLDFTRLRNGYTIVIPPPHVLHVARLNSLTATDAYIDSSAF